MTFAPSGATRMPWPRRCARRRSRPFACSWIHRASARASWTIVGGAGGRSRSFGGWVPATAEQRFANHRAEVFWHLRACLENGTAELPPDALLAEEATAMEWSQDGKGRILMISKEELRKSLKRSPDRLDAAAMALWAAQHGSGMGAFRPIYAPVR